MPGSDDQYVNMPTSADPVRQREPDPIVAQLRERMERLPHGHPSSPYNDDGCRKPPLPDLSQYELPIPGDPDYRPEPSGVSEADGPEAGQTSERATPGTHADDGPETTTDRPELSEAPPDAEPATDAEYTGHAQGVREEPDQVWAWGLAPHEEDTPAVRDEACEEREALHDAPADDLDERAANEPPVPAIPTISQSLGEPPKRKTRRKRHQRALTIASTQTTKLPQRPIYAGRRGRWPLRLGRQASSPPRWLMGVAGPTPHRRAISALQTTARR